MDKPPYKLTIKLTGNRSEALGQALERIDQLTEAANLGTNSETTVKISIETWKEEDVLAIRDDIEAFLKARKLILEGEVTLVSPVVRSAQQRTEAKQAAEQERLREWNAGKPFRVTSG